MKATWSYKEITKTLIALLAILQLVACNSAENFTQVADAAGTTSMVGTTGAVLSWVAPVARDDESPISMAEIAGYRIYYGTTQGTYPQQVEINDAYVDEFELDDLSLASGTYYAVMTTVDSDGRESGFSDEIILIV